MSSPTARYALAASASLLAAPTLAQAVPDPFPLGEIEYGLTIIPFTASDILAVERSEISGHPALQIALGHIPINGIHKFAVV